MIVLRKSMRALCWFILQVATCFNRTGYFEKAIDYTEILVKKNPDLSEIPAVKQHLLSDKEKYGSNKRSMVDPFSDYYVKNRQFTMNKEYIIHSQVSNGKS